MDELVQMHSNNEHNAEVLHSKEASEVKEQVDRKWINMMFTDIGTSITFQLDEARSDYFFNHCNRPVTIKKLHPIKQTRATPCMRN